MLLGNLGADPELRFTQGGQAVLNIRLATTESYLDRDKQRQERTEWHAVVVWGKRGEALAKILKKGDRVFVEGSLRTSSYDDREGNKRYKTEVHAREVILCGGRGGPSSREDHGYPVDSAKPPQRGRPASDTNGDAEGSPFAGAGLGGGGADDGIPW
jgi:single-strand DNA-binding protein